MDAFEPRTLTHALATYAARMSYTDFPDTVVQATRRSIIDTVAVAWAGSNAEGVSAARDQILEESGSPQSTIWGCGTRVPSPGAAFVNSLCAAAPDYDGLHPQALVHPGIVTVPAAFAVGEQVGAQGKEVLTAIAVADDLMCRMGLAHKTNRGWYLTAVYGGVAAAIAAAKVLRLDARGIGDAIGLALASAAGTQQCMFERSLAKRMQVAVATATGVRATLLAARNFGGLREGFEGPFGIYAMFEAGEADSLTHELGRRFENLLVCQKQYPCCGCSHAALEGVLQLVREYDLTVDRVVEIEARISPYMARLVGNPFDPANATEVTAQFSLQYALACALVFGKFGLDQIRPEAINDERVKTMADRVRLVVDPLNTGGVAPAEVMLILVDGRTLTRRIDHLRGSPDRPITDADIHSKALDCFAQGARPLSQANAQNRLSELDVLAAVSNMSTFFTHWGCQR
jgi:2-methylcitrate dehydratase PrpD